MEIVNHSPKPKPLLGICFPQIFLSEHMISHLPHRDPAPFAILKYFPKHIDSLPYDLPRSNLKTRIKHLKLIKRTSHHRRCNNNLRTLLANKRKTVKFASGVEDKQSSGGYNKKSLELLKMFPNIQKVEFCVERSFEDEDGYKWQAKQYFWIDKMSCYLRKMTHLKYLYLSSRLDYLFRLLSKLNSFETMLSGLEVFKMDFYYSSSEDLQALFNFPNILKHLTHLPLGSLDENFEKPLQLLPNSCPGLLFLSLELSNKPPSDVKYLQCLKDFQNLRRLSINCCKELDAFRHCEFPISLRELELFFDKTDWQSLVTKEAFYHNSEGLKNLEKLQIRSLPTKEEEITLQDFIEELLSKVLALKEFEVSFSPSRNSSKNFDICRFLSCFQHLNQSLQKLTFGDVKFQYNFVNLENAQAFNFPKLCYLELRGRSFSSLLEFENTLALVQTKPDAPAPEIKFENIKIDSGRSLLELFTSLKKVSEKKIELWIKYENKGEDDEYFKENYEQVKQSSENLKNVTLYINWVRGYPAVRWIKELLSLGKFFGKFGAYCNEIGNIVQKYLSD